MYAIFNGGKAAGCSRTHKHMQLFYKPDFPLFPDRTAELKEKDVPFRYFFRRLDGLTDAGPMRLVAIYKELLHGCASALEAVRAESREAGSETSIPHNVVMTTDWMILIPRRKAKIGRAAVNAAGMMGLVWVEDDDQLKEWKERGPAAVLSEVGVPRSN